MSPGVWAAGVVLTLQGLSSLRAGVVTAQTAPERLGCLGAAALCWWAAYAVWGVAHG